jgi:hypothetical protein
MREHRFTKKDLTKLDTIQAANEAIVIENFDTVRVSETMQLKVCSLHIVADPRCLAPVRGSSARLDDLLKALVVVDSPISRLHKFTKRF